MKNPLGRLIHKISHVMGTNEGSVESWWTPGRKLLIGFRCRGCGRLSGVHESVTESQIDRALLHPKEGGEK